MHSAKTISSYFRQFNFQSSIWKLTNSVVFIKSAPKYHVRLPQLGCTGLSSATLTRFCKFCRVKSVVLTYRQFPESKFSSTFTAEGIIKNDWYLWWCTL